MDSFEAALLNSIPGLRRFARAMVRDAALADDMVQDCLERALSRRHQFQAGTNLHAWLYTILRSCFLNHQRYCAKWRSGDEASLLHLPSAAGDPTTRIHLQELETALHALPPNQREVVLLIGLEDMTYEQAAEITGTTFHMVKSRLSRARATLRRLIDGYEHPKINPARAAHR